MSQTPLEQNQELQKREDPQALPVPNTFDEAAIPIVGMRELLEVIDNEDTKRMLIKQEIERREFVADWKMAKVFALAGFFTTDKGGMTAEQAMAKMQVGRGWGMGQAESIRHIYIVKGKPAVENEAVAAKLLAAGWSWVPEFIGGEGNDCKGCRLWISFKGNPFMSAIEGAAPKQVTVSFTEKHASDAKLLTKWESNTPGWKQNHYYWKAISQFKRFYAPGIMNGSVMYSEIDEIVDVTPAAPKMEPRRLATAPPQDAPKTEPKEERGESREEHMRDMMGQTGEDNSRKTTTQAPPATEEHQPPVSDFPDIIDREQIRAMVRTAEDNGVSQAEFNGVLKEFGFSKMSLITQDKYPVILGRMTRSDASE